MSKPRPVIDVLIPGLLNLPVYELGADQLLSSTPNLHKLLRFAEHKTSTASDLDSILMSALGLQQSGLPYAHAVEQKSDRPKILFKPVYLKSDINNAIVFPVKSDQDINILINDLSDYFKVDCDIKKLPDEYWMMTLHSIQPVLDMPHYLTAVGKKITHYLEQARARLDWFRLFNEMQMFLYQHQINQQRQQNGLPMINSLWCWGADAYKGEKREDIQWFSEDHLFNSLGNLYTGQASAVSEFSGSNIDTHAIVIDLSLLNALKGDNNQDLMQLLNQLESKYFTPLLKMKSASFTVHTAGHLNFEYSASMSLKFWKKKVALIQLLQ